MRRHRGYGVEYKCSHIPTKSTSLCTFCRAALAILLLAGAIAQAQEIENRAVVVQAEAEELPTAYGAPPDLSHGRISTLTKSYVLSPFSFELEAGYEGAIFRHGLPAQLFRQEIAHARINLTKPTAIFATHLTRYGARPLRVSSRLQS
jgi:hypothetical protein